MRHLFEAATFRRRERALAHVSTLAQRLPEELHERIGALVKACPDPDSAVLQLGRMATEKPMDLSRIASDTALIVPLITVFSQSCFLSEELLEHPDWLARVVLSTLR